MAEREAVIIQWKAFSVKQRTVAFILRSIIKALKQELMKSQVR